MPEMHSRKPALSSERPGSQHERRVAIPANLAKRVKHAPGKDKLGCRGHVLSGRQPERHHARPPGRGLKDRDPLRRPAAEGRLSARLAGTEQKFRGRLVRHVPAGRGTRRRGRGCHASIDRTVARCSAGGGSARGAKIRPARAPKGPGRPFSSERGRPDRSSRAARKTRGGRKAGAKEAARGRSAEAPRMEPPGREHPCRSCPQHGGLSRGPSSSWQPSWQPSSSSSPLIWLLAMSIPLASHILSPGCSWQGSGRRFGICSKVIAHPRFDTDGTCCGG